MPTRLANLPKPVAVSAELLTGSYTGVTSMQGILYRLTLDVTQADTAGTLTVVPMSPRYSDRLKNDMTAKFETALSVDPFSRSVIIQASGRRTRHNIDPRRFHYRAVVAGDGDQIAGVVHDPTRYSIPFLVLLRPSPQVESFISTTEKSIDARLRRPAPQRDSGGAAESADGKSTTTAKLPADLHGAIIRWVAALPEEYPEANLRSARTGGVNRELMHLFDDRHFSAAFGKPYDQLSEVEQYQVQAAFRPTEAEQREEMKPWEFLRDTFEGRDRSIGRQQILIAVQAQRVYHNWLKETSQRLDAVSPSPQLDAELNRLEEFTNASEEGLWPSERAALSSEITTTADRHRRESTFLLVRLELENVRGPEDAEGLSQFLEKNAELLEKLDEEDQTQVAGWVNERLDALLSGIAVEQLSGLKFAQPNRDALDRNAKWHEELQSKYAYAVSRPPFVALLQHGRSARNQLLAANFSSIQGELDKAPNIPALNAVLEKALPVSGDRVSPVGRKLIQRATELTAKIDRRQFLAKFSPREREWLDENDRVVPPAGTEVGPPTAREVELAILRSIAKQAGELLDGHVVRYHATKAGQGFIGFGIVIDIEVLEVSDLQCKPDERGGYECTYRLRSRSDLVKSPFLNRSQLQVAFTQNNKVTARDGIPGRQRFELTPDGWRSPSIESFAQWQKDVMGGFRGEGWDGLRKNLVPEDKGRPNLQ